MPYRPESLWPLSVAAVVVAAVSPFAPISASQAAPPKPSVETAPLGDVQGAERKTILDTVRVPVEAELKQKILFRVTELRVRSGWAFVQGELQTPAGERPDFRNTKYQAYEASAADGKPGFYAILRRESNGKGWKIVHYAIGSEQVIATEPLVTFAQPPYNAPRYVLFGNDPTHTQNGAERKAILDCVRQPIEKSLKQKVAFQVDHLRVLGDWAFLAGFPVRPDGGKIDYRKTRYKDAIENGTFDNNICALVQRKGGNWKIVEYILGATDVAWDGWDQKYHAPRALFPYRTAGPEKGAGLKRNETGSQASLRTVPRDSRIAAR